MGEILLCDNLAKKEKINKNKKGVDCGTGTISRDPLSLSLRGKSIGGNGDGDY